MRKIINAILIFSLLVFKVYGQADDLQSYIDEGVKLYDNGDFKGAIEQYKNALAIDKNSVLANYEIASTYFALEEYKNAIEHIDVVLSGKSNNLENAYILKGSALDMLGNTKEAIKSYKEGIKKFPNSNLLYYNIALTYYNIKDYKNSEDALLKSLTIKSTHASSHLLLGIMMSQQGKRVKSLLALYNFLLLEPVGKRAESAYQLLDRELKRGVTRQNDKETTITISSNKESDEFMAAELMLSLLEASKGIEENKDKTEYELFTTNTKSFFTILGELKKNQKGFWWDNYVDFFYDMIKEEHVEAFSYYITQSKEDEKITEWLKNNQKKTDALLAWQTNYNRK
jgi:hypothetical protein